MVFNVNSLEENVSIVDMDERLSVTVESCENDCSSMSIELYGEVLLTSLYL